jgi:hypothetical protein
MDLDELRTAVDGDARIAHRTVDRRADAGEQPIYGAAAVGHTQRDVAADAAAEQVTDRAAHEPAAAADAHRSPYRPLDVRGQPRLASGQREPKGAVTDRDPVRAGAPQLAVEPRARVGSSQPAHVHPGDPDAGHDQIAPTVVIDVGAQHQREQDHERHAAEQQQPPT